jgi:hypothetical protein
MSSKGGERKWKGSDSMGPPVKPHGLDADSHVGPHPELGQLPSDQLPSNQLPPTSFRPTSFSRFLGEGRGGGREGDIFALIFCLLMNRPASENRHAFPSDVHGKKCCARPTPA